MKQHTVNIGNSICHFKETDNIFDAEVGTVQIYGQAENITEFVKKIDLENEWIPFGYVLRIIHRNENSKNMTAFLYRIGEKF